MNRFRILRMILRTTGANKVFYGLLLFILVVAAALCFIEPQIQTYGDAVWYAFVSVSTIGFGDICAQTLIGRLLTIALSAYSLIALAIIPGVVVNYFNEINKIKNDQSIAMFLDKLEHLDELSRDELRELSLRVKKMRSGDKKGQENDID